MAKNPRSLSGKVVVITGGGRGIGAATARAFLARGARVAIGDLDPSTARDATLALPLDVTDRPAFSAFLDEVEAQLGPIDVLVNNAGIMPLAPVDEESEATAIRQLELNLHAVIHGSKEAVRRMRPRGTGNIVNIASMAGKAGIPGGATYSACKHGVVGFSEAMSLELRDTDIKVSVVMPALVSTELTAGVPDAVGVKKVTPEEVAEALVAAVEAGRFDVYVPRSAGVIHKVSSVLPRAAREWIAHAVKADRILLDGARSSERAAYEARAAASTPAAEALVEEKTAV